MKSNRSIGPITPVLALRHEPWAARSDTNALFASDVIVTWLVGVLPKSAKVAGSVVPPSSFIRYFSHGPAAYRSAVTRPLPLMNIAGWVAVAGLLRATDVLSKDVRQLASAPPSVNCVPAVLMDCAMFPLKPGPLPPP